MDSTNDHITALVELLDAIAWSDDLESSSVRTLPAVKAATGADLAPVYLLDARQESPRHIAAESERRLLTGYEVLPASPRMLASRS